MSTADLALKYDPIYENIVRDYYEKPLKFAEAFARAWFKLTHRDLGPSSAYLGTDVPKKEFLWQDPIPRSTGYIINDQDIAELKNSIASCGISISQMVTTAWAAAACYRDSDRRGGANGARLRLRPQAGWEVNQPEQLKVVLGRYRQIQRAFSTSGKDVSLADIIVLGGAAGIELAAKSAGVILSVPFLPGRTDASQQLTDSESFKVLEPIHDGFRNYLKYDFTADPEQLLIDRAQLLDLSAPEMTVLLGGLRVLNINFNYSPHGVLTRTPEKLTRDFFINLLDPDIIWRATGTTNVFNGIDIKTGEFIWTATRVDLIFALHPQLRAIAEVYASDDAAGKFYLDFIAAWNKVMNADRFDLIKWL